MFISDFITFRRWINDQFMSQTVSTVDIQQIEFSFEGAIDQLLGKLAWLVVMLIIRDSISRVYEGR